jgi:hypothetical protein
MVMAMAYHQLNQAEAARVALVKGTALARDHLPMLESGDLGSAWPNWVLAQALREEAEGLLKNDRKPGRATN